MIAVVLAGTGFFIYLQFQNDVATAVDSGLSSRADELSAVVRQEATSLAARRRHLVGRTESFAEVLELDGAVVDSSAVIGATDLLDAEELRAAAHGSTFLSRGSLPGLEGGARLLAAPVRTPAGERIVVVGTSTASRDESLVDLRQLLLIALPAALILASLAGYWVAAAALRPVEAMRARAKEISTAAPDERLPVPDTRDEVARLGETLNEMLSRIGDAMERERAFVADASHELRTPLRLERRRLADAFETVERRFNRRVGEAGREIELGEGGEVELRADWLRLGQAIGTLVDNALRYGAGTITLAARRAGEAVEIHVTDEGDGIPPEFLGRAFERFSRAPGVRDGGSGLGLAIVATVAEAHGGSAHAANRPDGGADVWLVIPVSSSAEDGAA